MILACWQRRDYAELARWLPASGARPRPWQVPTAAEVKAARRAYRTQALHSFRIVAVINTDPAAANIDAELLCQVQGELELRRRRYRMIHLAADARPLARGGPEGQWVPFACYALPNPPALRA